MNARRYISVLDVHLPTFINIHGRTTFQQDSASFYKAKASMEWFLTKNVNLLKWPENNPGLNPIENLWTLIKQNVSGLNPRNLEELK